MNNWISNSYNKQNTKNNKITEDKEKNDLNGGSPLENSIQDENTKFIAIARKRIDKV